MADPRRMAGPAPLSDGDAHTARALYTFLAPAQQQQQPSLGDQRLPLQCHNAQDPRQQQQAQAQAQVQTLRHAHVQAQAQQNVHILMRQAQQHVQGDGRAETSSTVVQERWREVVTAAHRDFQQQQVAVAAQSGSTFAPGGGGQGNGAFGHGSTVATVQAAPRMAASNAMAFPFPAARVPTASSTNWIQQQQQPHQQLQQQLQQLHQRQQVRDDPQLRERQMREFQSAQLTLHRQQQEQQEQQRQHKYQRLQEQRKKKREREREQEQEQLELHRRQQEQIEARWQMEQKEMRQRHPQLQQQQFEQEAQRQQQQQPERRQQQQLQQQTDQGAQLEFQRRQQYQLREPQLREQQQSGAHQPAFLSQLEIQSQFGPRGNFFHPSVWRTNLPTSPVPSISSTFKNADFSSGRHQLQHAMQMPVARNFYTAFPNSQIDSIGSVLTATGSSPRTSTFRAATGAGTPSNTRNIPIAPAPVQQQQQQAYGNLPSNHQQMWAMELEKAAAAVRSSSSSSSSSSQAQLMQTEPELVIPASSVCKHQEAATFTTENASRPDEAFLSSIAPRVSGGAAPSAVSTATAAVSTATGTTTAAPAARQKAQLGGTPVFQPVQAQGHMSTPSPIPPARSVVVPGMALNMPARTSVMRIQSLLNADEAVPMRPAPASKRPQKRKQDKLGPKSKTPKKKAPMKRVKKQKQAQKLLNGGPVSNLSNPTRGPAPSYSSPRAQVFDPGRFTFLGSQATRQLQQASDISKTRPVTPSIPQIPPLSKSAKQAAVTKSKALTQSKKRTSAKRRKKAVTTTPAALPVSPSSLHPSTSVSVSTNGVCSMKPDSTPAAGASLESGSAPRTHRQEMVSQLVTSALQHGGIILSAKRGRPQEIQPVSRSSQSSTSQLLQGATPQPAALPPPKQAGPGGTAAPRGAKSTAKRKGKVALPRSRPGAFAGANIQSTAEKLPGDLPAAPAVGTGAKVIPATAAGPAGRAHVENRTVVIFCKRDFMRYQAAKIWRKYQGQLKRHEEWRVVRMPGKRTRYLSSRYEEELRKAHDKSTRSHKKVGRSRKRLNARRPVQEDAVKDQDQVMTRVAAAPVAAVSNSSVNGDKSSFEKVLQCPPEMSAATSSVQLIANAPDDQPTPNGKTSQASMTDTSGSASPDVCAAVPSAVATVTCANDEAQSQANADSLQSKTDAIAPPLAQTLAPTSVETVAAPVTTTCTAIVVYRGK